jgi:hypothetical protein
MSAMNATCSAMWSVARERIVGSATLSAFMSARNASV